MKILTAIKSGLNLQRPQNRLIAAAGLFLLLLSTALTLAPAARARSFESQLAWRHWIGYAGWLLAVSAWVYFLKRNEFDPNPLLIGTTALLTGWGLLTIWRLEPEMGLKQTLWLLGGTAGLLIGLPYSQTVLAYLRRYKYLWLAAGLILTTLTLILGTNPSGFGPRLWLGCCGIYFQPSEPLKILLILFLAAYFADRQPFADRTIPLLVPTVLIAGAATLILIIQRDLGTAAILIFIYSSMIYIATGKKRLVVISLLGIAAASVTGYLLFDVVQLRFEAWLNPWLDPSGRSYQIVQSLIAIASGGMTGRGPGLGSPNLVPIAFSDFIFAAIGEEYGLPGTLGLILTFLILTLQAFTISLQSENRYLKYLAIGIATYFGSQSILIIGGNIRMLPLTGVTLPFFSYGGSSLVTSLFAFYLLISIDHNPGHKEYTQIETRPARYLAALLTFGFIGLTLVNGWWSFWRGPDLVTRTDNIRRAISDRYVQRGKILDRNGVPLSITTGLAGDFTRSYPQPDTVHVIGYTDPFFGQTGAEQSLDPILRGLENQSQWKVWVSHLLYGRPSKGLDARLSLDSVLQSKAAELMGETPGAAVVLNAKTGEIIVLYSSPSYDPNLLEENWELLNTNPNSPFINRATQGLYPPGPAIGPLLLASTQTSGPLPETITSLDVSLAGNVLGCSADVELPSTWQQAVSAGCPAPLGEIGLQLGEEGLTALFTDLGFYQVPDIRLETRQPAKPAGFPTPTITAMGQADIVISPLQLALAASAISNHGKIPPPVFLLEAQTGEGGWISTPPNNSGDQVFSPAMADQTAQNLAQNSLPIWQAVSYARTPSGQRLTWFVGGTLPAAENESGLVAVVLLEKPDPHLAALIGQALLASPTP